VAEAYGIDAALVRIGFVVAAFLGGIGVVLYVAAWLLVPEADTDGAAAPPRDAGAAQVIAFVLLGVGALLVVARLVPDRPHVAGVLWPLALIAGGLAILVSRARDAAPAPTDTPGVPPRPPEPPPAAVASPDATVAAATAPPADRPLVPGAPEPSGATATAWMQTAPWPTAPARPTRPPRPRPFLGPLTVSVLLLGGGVAALVDTLDVVDVDAQAALAVALAAIGGALVVSAWFGRARGLVALGLVLVGPLVVLTIVDVPIEGGVGERVHRPLAVAELRAEYRLAAGTMTLDLTGIDLEGEAARIEASVAFGELRVVVPADVAVEVDASAGAGEIDVLGRRDEGLSVRTDRVAPAADGAGALRLELRVGMGSLEVEQRDEPASPRIAVEGSR
jgi:hypothetical protein